MEKKLYSYSIMAQQRGWGYGSNTLVTRHRAGVVVTSGKHEALGIAIEKARETFPESEQYFNHGVSVFEIPEKFITIVKDCTCGGLDE